MEGKVAEDNFTIVAADSGIIAGDNPAAGDGAAGAQEVEGGDVGFEFGKVDFGQIDDEEEGAPCLQSQTSAATQVEERALQVEMADGQRLRAEVGGDEKFARSTASLQ